MVSVVVSIRTRKMFAVRTGLISVRSVVQLYPGPSTSVCCPARVWALAGLCRRGTGKFLPHEMRRICTVRPLGQAGAVERSAGLVVVASADARGDLCEGTIPVGSAIESLFSTSKYSFELT